MIITIKIEFILKFKSYLMNIFGLGLKVRKIEEQQIIGSPSRSLRGCLGASQLLNRFFILFHLFFLELKIGLASFPVAWNREEVAGYRSTEDDFAVDPRVFQSAEVVTNETEGDGAGCARESQKE